MPGAWKARPGATSTVSCAFAGPTSVHVFLDPRHHQPIRPLNCGPSRASCPPPPFPRFLSFPSPPEPFYPIHPPTFLSSRPSPFKFPPLPTVHVVPVPKPLFFNPHSSRVITQNQSRIHAPLCTYRPTPALPPALIGPIAGRLSFHHPRQHASCTGCVQRAFIGSSS